MVFFSQRLYSNLALLSINFPNPLLYFKNILINILLFYNFLAYIIYIYNIILKYNVLHEKSKKYKSPGYFQIYFFKNILKPIL